MKLENFLVCMAGKKGDWGEGIKHEREEGKGVSSLSISFSLQSPLLFPFFLQATKGNGFNAFLGTSELNCSRMPSASFRMDSAVPTWSLPKSCRLSVSSVLFWIWQISLSSVITSCRSWKLDNRSCHSAIEHIKTWSGLQQSTQQLPPVK